MVRADSPNLSPVCAPCPWFWSLALDQHSGPSCFPEWPKRAARPGRIVGRGWLSWRPAFTWQKRLDPLWLLEPWVLPRCLVEIVLVDDRTCAPFPWSLMESRGVTLVTLPDLCCHHGLCSVPWLRLEPCSLNQAWRGEPATGLLVHLNLFTPVADRGNWIWNGEYPIIQPQKPLVVISVPYPNSEPCLGA